jgi:superfamily II DNA or RNA helicase
MPVSPTEAASLYKLICQTKPLKEPPVYLHDFSDGICVQDSQWNDDMEDHNMEDDMFEETAAISLFEQQKRILERIKANKYLFPHQKDALNALAKHRSKHDVSLIVLPTGAGKSMVAFLAPYVLQTKQVLVITPSIIITKQLMQLYSGEHKSFEASKLFRSKSDLEKSRQILLGKDLVNVNSSFLTIVNAQKFGTSSEIDIGSIPNTDLVIIDEAHHYPTGTWENIVKHFCHSRKLFLTVTPYNKNKLIVPKECIAYDSLSPDLAVKKGILRPVKQVIIDKEANDDGKIALLGDSIINALNQHDKQDNLVKHQAMILTRTIGEAVKIVEIINSKYPETTVAYCRNVSKCIVKDFESNLYKIIVICGRLLKRYDRSSISVMGIHRKVRPESRVLYAQYVSKSFTKAHKEDSVTALIISHISFKQQENFDRLNVLADMDPKNDKYVKKELTEVID